MTGDSTDHLLALLYVLLLGAAAVQDAMTLRISNLLSVAILIVGAVGLALDPGENWWQHLLAFAIMLGLGIALFSFKWMGGGDAKLLAAAALAFDLVGLVRFIVATLMAGGLLAIVAVAIHLVRGKGLRRGIDIPYGVAVAAGAAACVWLFRDSSVFAA